MHQVTCFDQDGRPIPSFQEFLEKLDKERLAVRAIIEFGSMYLMGKAYGLTAYVRQLQCCDRKAGGYGEGDSEPSNGVPDYSAFMFA